jgi:hypothetical protein
MRLRQLLAALFLTIIAAPSAAQTDYHDDSGPGGQGWAVHADPATDYARLMNTEFRRQNVPVFVDVIEFEISRDDRANDDAQHKHALVDKWVTYISDYIETEGFSAIDPEEVSESTGASMEQLREKLRKSVPYGSRNHFGRFGELMPMLIDERPSDCRGGDGALAAFVMSIYPPSAVRSDYGSIMVAFMGFGDCGPLNSRARRTIGRIKSELAEDFGGGER